jgi:cytochrome c5
MVRIAILLASLGLLTACATTETAPTTAPSGASSSGTPAAPPAATASSGQLSAAADAQGKSILEASCTTCHDLATTTGERKTAAQWEATISDMISRGALVGDADVPKLRDYLAAHYGAS